MTSGDVANPINISGRRCRRKKREKRVTREVGGIESNESRDGSGDVVVHQE
jgi:hypothetical protein